MSQYITELCEAYCRVIDHATESDADFVAGYVVNLDFWVAEARHVLDLIDGYPQRSRAMLTAIRAHGGRPRDSSAFDKRAKVLRDRVLTSTHHFLRRCAKLNYLDTNKLFAVEDRLQANFRGAKPFATT